MKELLPSRPVDCVVVEPWWIVQTGYIVEEDVKVSPFFPHSTVHGAVKTDRCGNSLFEVLVCAVILDVRRAMQTYIHCSSCCSSLFFKNLFLVLLLCGCQLLFSVKSVDLAWRLGR